MTTKLTKVGLDRMGAAPGYFDPRARMISRERLPGCRGQGLLRVTSYRLVRVWARESRQPTPVFHNRQ